MRLPRIRGHAAVSERGRKAFTLGEVLIAIAIVAAVAAVVLPTIVAQVNKSDPQRVGQDAAAIRAAISQFVSDVRRYPTDFDDLVTKPVNTKDALIGGDYTNADILRWAGPYLTKTATAARATGYGLSFTAAFGSNLLGETGLGAGTQRFLTLDITIGTDEALAVDKLVDDGDITTGVFRWATGTMKVLVMPVQ